MSCSDQPSARRVRQRYSREPAFARSRVHEAKIFLFCVIIESPYWPAAYGHRNETGCPHLPRKSYLRIFFQTYTTSFVFPHFHGYYHWYFYIPPLRSLPPSVYILAFFSLHFSFSSFSPFSVSLTLPRSFPRSLLHPLSSIKMPF